MSAEDLEVGTVLKEGFLVKKGHVRKNWRTRWFQLRRDRLSYFNHRSDLTPINTIWLQGCSIIRPREEKVRHPHRFELKTAAGKSYFLEAPSSAEVDSWTSAIARTAQSETAMRRNVSVMKKKSREVSVSQYLDADATSKELVEAMQDVSAGIKLGKHTLPSGRECESCFSGQQMIDWLLEWGFCETREAAGLLGMSLLNGGFVKPVDDRMLATEEFLDSTDTLYQFVALHVTNRGGSLPFSDSPQSPVKSLSPLEMVSESEGESSGEDDLEEVDETLKAMGLAPDPGNSASPNQFDLKQGILLKQGHKRKNWKARRFLLMADALYYYRASKPQSDPIGRIPLKGAYIVNNDDQRRAAASFSLGNSTGPLFCITTMAKVVYMLQATDEEERADWVGAIQKCIARQTGGSS